MDLKLNEVFKANPKAEEIFTVGSVPFVNKRHAQNYAREVNKEVVTHKRPGSSEEAPAAGDAGGNGSAGDAGESTKGNKSNGSGSEDTQGEKGDGKKAAGKAAAGKAKEVDKA